ncbi:MAG: HEPN domain-containing protein [Ignavibacteriaceae bacterium]|nr:HEPN domain-containing protein [Ignavibacteriaceae bacterium]
MVKKSIRAAVDRSKFISYKIVAENFYNGAKIASEYNYYNAAGVLIVHAAIAFADAVTIKYNGTKSKGDDHREVITLLEEILPSNEERKKSINHLDAIIVHKNAVSYSGDVYNKKDIEQLWKHLERFKSWAITFLK